jgi:hypothetical protein
MSKRIHNLRSNSVLELAIMTDAQKKEKEMYLNKIMTVKNK